MWNINGGGRRHWKKVKEENGKEKRKMITEGKRDKGKIKGKILGRKIVWGKDEKIKKNRGAFNI